MRTPIPRQVLVSVTGRQDAELIDCTTEPLRGSTGAATAGVCRIAGTARIAGATHQFTLVRKQFRPLTSGPHAKGARDPRHWAYWKRELLAYQSGVVPTGHELRAPRCLGIVGDALYLENVVGPTERPAIAARRLGDWQARVTAPQFSWLAGHQLAQRVAVTNLNWTETDVDPEFAAIWSRRHRMLDELRDAPDALCHGDFHAGNLLSSAGTTVAFDWNTIGKAPVGADLAHLALSCQQDLVDDYLAGLGAAYDTSAVLLGYRTTLALTAASRLHWMWTRRIPIPPGYQDFALSQL